MRQIALRLIAFFILFCSGLTRFPSAVAAPEPVNVSFYECSRCQTPPMIDGKLDDACWQNLPVMEDFYQYWSPTPKPPPLKTEAKLCYDDTALYMGITLFDEQIDKIRATIASRDSGNTWSDDCVEIMIDPGNSGTGYLKFTTNFLCARYDERVTGMEMNAGWNAEGWKVKTSKEASAWYIEASFPWSDLGAQAKEGDVWAFDLVRYGYSSGSFRGVTWSLGGSYASPQNFGYLGFGKFTPPDEKTLDRMAAAFSKTKGKCFRLLLPELVLTHDPSGTWGRQDLRSWVEEATEDASQGLRAAGEALNSMSESENKKALGVKVSAAETKLRELQKKYQQAAPLWPSTASLLRENSLRLRREVEELRWEGLLQALVESQ